MSFSEEIKHYKRIGVFGLGRFGFGLAVWLSELGADVLAVDMDRTKVEEIDQRVSRAIALDATSDFTMAKLDVASLDLAIVCIGRNIQSSLLATAILHKHGAKAIWARAIDQSQAEILEAIGVERIVSLEKEMARQVAQSIMMPGTRVIGPITVNHSLAEVVARGEFVGKTLRELNFRKDYGLNVVAIKSRITTTDARGRERVEVKVNDLPDADDIIREGDVLVVIGADEHIANLQKGG
jgi:trk system potassium uptake protein TrkA